jgi:V/A-type H+-transporting ATPase subunit D
MSDASPTRAVVLELKDEQRAMREGHVFLDEKCLLLAGEILRELERHAALEHAMLSVHEAALKSLQSAVARHGLEDLQVYPALDQSDATLVRETTSIMGVRLQRVTWRPSTTAARPSVVASPEGEACRRGFVALIESATRLAAVSGNLERLSFEYRRSVRRARALQDVLLPELDRAIHVIEGRLEELEQEDAISMRRRAVPNVAGDIEV